MAFMEEAPAHLKLLNEMRCNVPVTSENADGRGGIGATQSPPQGPLYAHADNASVAHAAIEVLCMQS